MAVPLATGRCGHRPHKNNVRFQRWGRCPHRPVGYDTGAVKKNEHVHTIGFRADVGIGPYEKQHAFSALGALPTKTTCVFSVGGDALIAPPRPQARNSPKASVSINLSCHSEEHPKGTCFAARSDVGIRNLLAANLHENA